MARFRGTVIGNRGEASRLGAKTSGITADINGWDLGVSVEGRYDARGDCDVFSVYLTKGSNNPGRRTLIGRFTKDVTNFPKDE